MTATAPVELPPVASMAARVVHHTLRRTSEIVIDFNEVES